MSESDTYGCIIAIAITIFVFFSGLWIGNCNSKCPECPESNCETTVTETPETSMTTPVENSNQE